MFGRIYSYILVALLVLSPAYAMQNGVVKAKSAYSMQESVKRVTDDIKAKGIEIFNVIDQAKLAKEAGIEIRPSTLIIFGNPPLGTQFIQARAEAGLDWPVRILVYEDAKGQVWAAYSDWGWVAKRHNIKNRGPQFKMATEVVDSILSALRKM